MREVLGPAGAHLPASRSSPVRVLLVEDDEGDAFLVRELLLDSGHDVELTRARTLGEAVERLPGEVDCVLLDLGLPDADGMTALRSVLEVAPTIAVIVLTGLADEHRGTEAVASGAQDYLVKGAIDGQLLTRAVRYAVERKRADESVRRLYASEVRAAENARLERGLLPLPLVASGVEVHRLYRPGRHQSLLGGDFYDVVESQEGTVFALIGDVAGHGPDEAALGVCLRIAWRTLVLSGADPDTIFGAMHDVLVSERASEEVFATVAMVRIVPDREVATFWLAGHPIPFVIEGAQVRPGPEEATGIALGVLDGVVWVGRDTAVRRGSTVVLFTDGLFAGFDGPDSGRRLGEDGLLEILDRLLADDVRGKALNDGLLAEVQQRNGGDLTDDVALVALTWAPTA